MSSPAPPFEPRLVVLHKRRAAQGFDQAAFLHHRAAEDLADRLEAIPRNFDEALVLGAPRIVESVLNNRPDLRARIRNTTFADIAPASGEIAADLEAIHFDAESFDLVVSPLLLHWANDLPGALVQLRRALKPDGLLLATIFGGETLNELRLSFIEAESELLGGAGPRVAPFAELQDLAGLLQRASFALPAADRDRVAVRYGDPMRLLMDLRAMGETSALAERPPANLSRRILFRAMEIYRTRFSDPDGRVRATFDLLTMTGWAPHESQQKPLRPGSAKSRLADALNSTEHSAGEKPGES
ncbi:MAG: methyltransferase domain-containing protein [Caulobacterales bacterium]